MAGRRCFLKREACTEERGHHWVATGRGDKEKKQSEVAMELLPFDAFPIFQPPKCIHLYSLFLLVSPLPEGFSLSISDAFHV